MIKVLVVTNSISGGGAERAMNLLVNSLSLKLKNLFLVTINQSQFENFDLVVPVITINRVWRGSFANTLKSWVKFQIKLIQLKPDVLILNCDLPEFYGAVSLTRAKLICVEHTNHPWIKRKRVGTVIRFILKLKGVIWVAVSNHLYIWPNQSIPDHVINNLVWETSNQSTKFHGAIKRLVFIGRLSYEKGPELFLEIVDQTGIPALIMGDGELRLELEKFTKFKSLNVEFKGFTPNPWANLTSGDLLIITSKWEGDGLVAVEAIQRKIPLIVSKIEEFERFKLPSKNYARNKFDYISLITLNKNRSEVFIVNPKIRNQILSSRDTNKITLEWYKLINSIVKSI